LFGLAGASKAPDVGRRGLISVRLERPAHG
jgi:hypothetical protein